MWCFTQQIIVIISLLKCSAQEHNWPFDSLMFSGCSSLYRISIIGALLYYYHLFSQKFSDWYNNAMKHTLVYIKSTLNYRIMYKGGESLSPVEYVDSNYAGCKDT